MPGASLALFADLGACHVQKSSVTICVLPAPFRWRETEVDYIVQHRIGISIHALRVEGDRAEEQERVPKTVISIHALRVEGDNLFAIQADFQKYFYPRPPGGGRRRQADDFRSTLRISIHALRVEGDSGTPMACRTEAISIHALRVEGDSKRGHGGDRPRNFYPRPPGGGRPRLYHRDAPLRYFYPRPPGGGRLFRVSIT